MSDTTIDVNEMILMVMIIGDYQRGKPKDNILLSVIFGKDNR